MKFYLATLLALGTLATSSAAFADNHNHNQNRNGNHGRQMARGHMSHANYREGQMYHGHRLHNYNGRWGYYQPRNGANVFISIPL
jgi:hypothetical protein